jgi:translation initiation factor IF-1
MACVFLTPKVALSGRLVKPRFPRFSETRPCISPGIGQISGPQDGLLKCFAAFPNSRSEFWHRVACSFLDDQRQNPSQRLSVWRDAFIMSQDKTIEIEGIITSVLPGTMFHVELANNHTVLAHISGKMRKRFIRLLNGDRVKLEMSPYDLKKARIVYRLG